MTFDPTTNRVPWELLSDEEREVLRNWPHGLKFWDSNYRSWSSSGVRCDFHGVLVYRAKPAPEQKLEVDWSALHDDVIAVTQDVGGWPELHHGIPTCCEITGFWTSNGPSMFLSRTFFKCATPADNGGPDAIVWRPGHEPK